jgi:DNA-binding GntR family transcriptional regulator
MAGKAGKPSSSARTARAMAEPRAASGSVRRAKRTRGTGASYVYNSLKALILDLELKPGTLLDETLVSRQFSVSRSPVREALIRLSAEGLVQTLRNRTSIVAQFDVGALPAYFDAMQLLYRVSARLAAANATPSQIDRLWQIVRDHEDALHKGDMKSMVRLNHDFHTAIAIMSGNLFIANWMRGLLDQGQRLLRLYAYNLGDHVPDTVLKPHRDIVAAIAAGDGEKAEDAGRADAQALIDAFKRNLSDRPTAPLALDAARPRKSPVEEMS